MATPYFQVRRETVPSTQDVARELLRDLPILVVAAAQSSGRGRRGAQWLNADRALAVSLVCRVGSDDMRPFSLMAGVAATRVIEGAGLKWPNDLFVEDLKIGGILVERSGDLVTIGLGLNLWWPEPPQGMTALHESDPGEECHAELGGLWGAEMMGLIDSVGWPIREYRRRCVTLGRRITWEPGPQSGIARDVADDGGLVVETESELMTLFSGTVREVR